MLPLVNQGNHIVKADFKQCFDTYFEQLYHYAFTIVKDNAEASDIVQSAFTRLWEKRNEVNIQTAGRAYLYTAVYHLSLNFIRNRRSREAHHQQMRVADQVSYYSAEEKEIRRRIHEVIESLPPKCREVFCKSRMEGKRYAEIASEMDISVKTVEVQMGKALKFLREHLADLVAACIIQCFLYL